MYKKAKWSDDYWLLLMQIYLQEPVGVKSVYSRQMIDLSLELHIDPNSLHARMARMAKLKTPRIEHIWQTYGQHPDKLARAVRLWREMRGYGNADEFYEGVEVNETFERDFRPVAGKGSLTPVMLTMVLDLYFRLTPITMVEQTPEVIDLANLLCVTPQQVAEALTVFQYCDPYLNRRAPVENPLFEPCREIWRRYGNGNTEDLVAYAERLKEYFQK